jgi:hypothetical protein
MNTTVQIRGDQLADLALVVQDLLDQIEALTAIGADRSSIDEMVIEVRELRATRGR